MATEFELVVWLTASGALGWIALGLPVPTFDKVGRPAKRARFQLDTGVQKIVARELVADLPLVLGTDLVVDLARLPHILVAGASGSGKSVALHAMIQGLLASDRADVWIVDPKMVEGAPYASVARVAYRDGALALLKEAVTLMDSRYRTMLQIGVRQWEGRALVLVIDEFGDLILGGARSSARAVEKSLIRIAQMGRAAAIHLVLATQRPSADVVTPLIRANVPGRLALRCASASDSRIIRGDGRAYSDLVAAPIGSALWGDRIVRAPYVDPYGD